eukprot:m.102018 g.102018  ORF g.102018 m.102018 type:complete len:69 (-) comp15674_c0_seq2:1060-1266(-)
MLKSPFAHSHCDAKQTNLNYYRTLTHNPKHIIFIQIQTTNLLSLYSSYISCSSGDAAASAAAVAATDA